MPFGVPEDSQQIYWRVSMTQNFLFCDFLKRMPREDGDVHRILGCLKLLSVPRLSQGKIDWEAPWDRKQMTASPLLLSLCSVC